ncbi:conserved hypothetical protein (plasmid) [Rhodococcus jostii RHA1]|uniref:Uncharacterized protein n=1 Tax=Rhodococcus jostii (strain RHA1) TaxID=101510 RepID=Q0RXG2_RHOJR|nr:conserved hypothetical protein [Rhodococcus jostii RHA1]
MTRQHCPGTSFQGIHSQHGVDGRFVTSAPCIPMSHQRQQWLHCRRRWRTSSRRSIRTWCRSLWPAYTATSIRNDERNAPVRHVPRSQADPDLESLREQVNSDIDAGVSTERVADLVVQGMAERKTHIFQSPEWVDYWQDRVDRVKRQLD